MQEDIKQRLINCEPLLRDKDVYFFDDAINLQTSEHLISLIKNAREPRNTTGVLFLLTPGGSPDEAYRMARAMQNHYDEFVVAIPKKCKSAGTILCTGADALIMWDDGELGPLDIQIAQDEELFSMNSSLDPINSVTRIASMAERAFHSIFQSISTGYSPRVSTKSAARYATDIVETIFPKLAEQIDPLKVTQAYRLTDISSQYCQRLNKGNFKTEAVQELISGYPSHGFVIDQPYAQRYFNRILNPDHDIMYIWDTILKLQVANPYLLNDYVDKVTKGQQANDSSKTQEQAIQPETTPNDQGTGSGSVSEGLRHDTEGSGDNREKENQSGNSNAA